jgi:hypothetical protein
MAVSCRKPCDRWPVAYSRRVDSGRLMSSEHAEPAQPHSCNEPGCQGWRGTAGPEWVQLQVGDGRDDDHGFAGLCGVNGDPACSCRGTGALVLTRPVPEDLTGPFVITRCPSCDVFLDDAGAAMFVTDLLKRAASLG